MSRPPGPGAVTRVGPDVLRTPSVFTILCWSITILQHACTNHFKKRKKKLFFQLLSIQPARATQSMMYVPLRVNRFQIIILLIVQYKDLKSRSKHFILQNLILDTRLCSTGFITQPSWKPDFSVTNIVRIKRFVLAVYQYQNASQRGRPWNIFTLFIGSGGQRGSPFECKFSTVAVN